MKRWILVMLLACANVPGQEASDATKSFDQWVNQLGADRFRARKAAEDTILELAQDAPLDALKNLKQRLAKEDDPEIRLRIQRVLPKIAALPIDTIPFNEDTLAEELWELDPSSGKFPYTLEEGMLEYNSLSDQKKAFVFRHAHDLLPGKRRLSLDAEIKVIQEQHDRGSAGMHLNIEDERATQAAMITGDGVFFYRSARIHKLDTSKWHHYRLVIEGDVQQLFIDNMNTPVLEQKRGNQEGRNWVSFGDTTAGAAAHVQIRKVVFSVGGKEEADTAEAAADAPSAPRALKLLRDL